MELVVSLFLINTNVQCYPKTWFSVLYYESFCSDRDTSCTHLVVWTIYEMVKRHAAGQGCARMFMPTFMDRIEGFSNIIGRVPFCHD